MSFGRNRETEGVPRFILYNEIANFKAEGWRQWFARLVYLYAYSPRCIAAAYTARVDCFIFISAMVFGDTSYKMSKDRLPAFFILKSNAQTWEE